MERKDALHADAVGDLAHGKGAAVSFAGYSDHDSFENLRPLFFAFDHFHVDANGLSRPQVGNFFFALVGFELL